MAASRKQVTTELSNATSTTVIWGAIGVCSHFFKCEKVSFFFVYLLHVCHLPRKQISGWIPLSLRESSKKEDTWTIIVLCPVTYFFFSSESSELKQVEYATLLTDRSIQVCCGWSKTAEHYRFHILRELHTFPWDISNKHLYLNIIYVGGKSDIVSVAEGSYPSC